MKHLQSLSYKVLFAIFFFALAGIVFFLKIGGKTTKVSATWWDNSWHYRKSITLTNSSGIGQSNVLVKVMENYNLSNLVNQGKLQSDLDDLRFTNSSDTPINYWIEDSTNTAADVWAIIPSFPTSGATIWMYYGNSSATAGGISPFSYSGTSQIISDGNGKFRAKLLTNGNFVPSSNMIIDAFLVGGGGGSITTANGGGAGGGYTTNSTNVSISIGTTYATTIGNGGTAGAQGGTTQFNSLSAVGGYTNSGSNGGNGGSGGGYGGPWFSGGGGYYCCAGPGASNGAGAGGGCASGGSGQGTTTYEFAGSSGDLYAGGGGGYGGYNSPCGNNWKDGGAGGGGAAGVAGTANTGGGAGANGLSGGSGIVVLRYTSPGANNVNLSEENNFVSSGGWWNSSWIYRQSIGITNSCGTAKTYTLVKVLNNYNLSALISAGKIQSNLNDLRFVDSNNNSVDYLIQDSTNTSVDIWAILPSLPATGTTIIMYYGNPSATAVSTLFYTYGGSSQLIDDGGTQFRIKFTSSNTFSILTNVSVDTFLVGGGGGGNGYGGGGGGYTNTHSAVTLTANTGYSITIGDGGGNSTNGSSTTGFSYTAAGGYAGNTYTGGNGGSGGGGGAYVTGSGWPGVGGANGGNGAEGCNGNTYACNAGGSGQGTTTYEFAGSSGDLYGGGGGGHLYYSTWKSHSYAGGGAGGGGTQSAGTANTGGGGSGGNYAGGSGIAIIRYTSCGLANAPTTEVAYSLPASANRCLIEESPKDTQLIVKWADNSTNEDGYLVQKSTNQGAWTDIYNSDPDIITYTDTSISSNNTYQYRISPYLTGSSVYNWCYTSVLNLGQGNLNVDGLNLDGVNLD